MLRGFLKEPHGVTFEKTAFFILCFDSPKYGRERLHNRYLTSPPNGIRHLEMTP
jgi:hypothetical protein